MTTTDRPDRDDGPPVLDAGPTLRWRALVRSYFAARRQGMDPGPALDVAFAVLGITPAARPVVPAGWAHL